ncbi:hypothetical protein M3Y94_00025700 [Aphelenchoides besseyi]|nr:hypothetical protein M3Y94_00025700 [Aphelenchoides besseyi]
MSCSNRGINLTLDRDVRIGFGYHIKSVDLSLNPTPRFNGKRLFSRQEKAMITKLDMNNMNISEFIPGSFTDFRNLKILNLKSNKLTNYLGYTPKNEQNKWLEEGRTLQLETLDLSFNQLKNFPKELSTYFPNLRKLDLSHNRGLRLDDFNEFIFPAFDKLEVLILDNCDLTTVDEYFLERIKNVRVLSLVNNPIQVVPEGLKMLKRLELLDLSRTEIRSMNLYAFERNRNLRILMMQNSAIEEVTYYCTYCGGLRLTEINFRDSHRLRKIDSFNTSFARLWDLQNCNLSTLEEIHDSRYYSNVELSGNPWHCNRSLNWVSRLPNASVSSAYCSSPYYLRGVPIKRAMRELSGNEDPPTTPSGPWNWRYPYRASTRGYDEYDYRPFWEVDSRHMERWWSREASPFIQRLMREPLTFFVAGALSSAVLLLLFWCGCQLCCCGLSCLCGRVKREFRSLDSERNCSNCKDDKEPLISEVLRTPMDRARQLQRFLATRGANRWNFESPSMRQHINDVSNDEDTETIASVISTETTPIDEMEQCRWTPDRPCAVAYEKN